MGSYREVSRTAEKDTFSRCDVLEDSAFDTKHLPWDVGVGVFGRFSPRKSWEFIKVESDEFSFWGQWPMFRGEVLVFRDEMGHVETCGANFHPPKIFFVVDIHLPKMWTRDIFHQGKQKQLHFSSYCSKKVLGRQFISASYVSLNPSLPDFQIKGYINWSTLRGCWIISTKKDIYIYIRIPEKVGWINHPNNKVGWSIPKLLADRAASPSWIWLWELNCRRQNFLQGTFGGKNPT